MNSREQRLLIAFGSVLLLVGGYAGYSALGQYHTRVKKDIATHKATLQVAQFAQEQADAVQAEIEWLNKNLPDPKEAELVPSQLENLVTSRATGFGLTVTKPTILENATDGIHYERARFKINVSGSEQSLYQWLVAIHSPRDFRAVTLLRLSPNREDDTKIDAEVQVEEWFVPKSSEEPS
ncbi:MAG: type II secretion system protein M [Akkermansiaceae bacterium]|jgi:hypothetical protein|nr:type II secretion system protein M [Akkermansiaceae bacterium]